MKKIHLIFIAMLLWEQATAQRNYSLFDTEQVWIPIYEYDGTVSIHYTDPISQNITGYLFMPNGQILLYRDGVITSKDNIKKPHVVECEVNRLGFYYFLIKNKNTIRFNTEFGSIDHKIIRLSNDTLQLRSIVTNNCSEPSTQLFYRLKKIPKKMSIYLGETDYYRVVKPTGRKIIIQSKK